ncbi:MAG TPA: hypothetical protein DIC59_15400 [Candidatus Competibacteraceae bacterium]|nr:hypothetical protein [Candidatus Competibacteraceae bacterium]
MAALMRLISLFAMIFPSSGSDGWIDDPPDARHRPDAQTRCYNLNIVFRMQPIATHSARADPEYPGVREDRFF